MKKLAALLLALCLGFSVAACGGNSVTGSWAGSVNLADVLDGDMGELRPYFSDLSMNFYLDLKSDNRFTMRLDANSMRPALKEAFRSYLSDQLATIGMTPKDYEEATGTSLDEMINASLEQMDLDEASRSFAGTYTEDRGQLVLTAEDGSVFSGSWNQDSLSLVEASLGQLDFTRK